MKKVKTGLDILSTESNIQSSVKGNIGYLCNSASITSNYVHGIQILLNCFNTRLTKIFSPQHGLLTEVQDNMIKSNHFFHPYFKLPVYSLYSETRKPTKDMLEGLDCVIIDLQDVGTRIYTYIYTMTLMMEACVENGIEVIVLDRPNPINGNDIEGNILDLDFHSFIGRHPLPMRHGLTIGEVALMAQKYWGIECDIRIIKMQGWQRTMKFQDTQLPWVFTSPNLHNIDTAFIFPGSVLFEGTNISEGRGTTKSLEMIGHPKLNHYELIKQLQEYFRQNKLEGFILRPLSFIPIFQKHKDRLCNGYQIHITNYAKFKPWAIGQVLCQKLYYFLGDDFQWKNPPYEYEFDLMPIDILNGSDCIRKWVESNGSFEELLELETIGREEYKDNKSEILLY